MGDGEGRRLVTVTGSAFRSTATAAVNGTGKDELEYDSLALLAPQEAPKKAPLAHMTGLRGLFIVLVVLLHFIPRPYENPQSTSFVDQVDVAKGWYVQDVANIFINRLPAFGMPYLFVASGFGLHLTYRKKSYNYFDFCVDRLARMVIMLWLCIVIELVFDRLPNRFQPYFQPKRTSYYTYFFNAITLGILRPAVIQVHNLFFLPGDKWPMPFITPTTSESLNQWLATKASYVPTILPLWFLSYTMMCTLLYPIIAKLIAVVDRFGGIAGLAGFCFASTLVAMLPMLIDRGEVHLFFNGSTWNGGPSWNGHREDDIWTDEPWKYTHYTWKDGPTWYGGKGKRHYATEWREKPELKLPWFLDEPSVFWPIGYILWFACGVATVHAMNRLEDWRRARKLDEAQAGRSVDVQMDAQEGDMEAEAAQLLMAASSRRASWLSGFGMALTSHEGRGCIADLCVLLVLVPCFAFPFDYNKGTYGYFNRYGFNEIANWNKAYIPVACLFLYGSASRGGAGFFAEHIFSSGVLVATGEISLAIYALQAIVARICGVRWFLRGPNQEDYCKDLEDFYEDMPGKFTVDAHNITRAKMLHLEDKHVRELTSAKLNCLNSTGEQVTLLLVLLFIIANQVTSKVEPYLDEKIRAGVTMLPGILRRVVDAICTWIRSNVRWNRSSRDGEREVLMSGVPPWNRE